MNICDKMSDNEIKLTGITFMCAIQRSAAFKEGLRLRGDLTEVDELVLGIAVKSPVDVNAIRHVLNKIYNSLPEENHDFQS